MSLIFLFQSIMCDFKIRFKRNEYTLRVSRIESDLILPSSIFFFNASLSKLAISYFSSFDKSFFSFSKFFFFFPFFSSISSLLY